MKAYRPTQANPPAPHQGHPMAGVHQHPPIMPYPHPVMAGPYGHPPPYYGPPGMYGPPPPPPGPMPPLIPTTKPLVMGSSEDKKANDALPAGSTSDTTKEVKPVKTEDNTKKEGTEGGGEGEEGDGKATEGLDLLASLAIPVNKNGAAAKAATAADGEEEAKKEDDEDDSGMPPLTAPFDPKNPNAAAIAILQKESKNKKKKSRMEEMSPKEKLFVDKVRESDVLCGRGGKSNHHPGNKRYRQVVSEMKRTYQSTGAKTAKTDLSRAIVEHVVSYGGRFIKRDESTGQYFLLTKAQARRKTSQALRETKELKWTI